MKLHTFTSRHKNDLDVKKIFKKKYDYFMLFSYKMLNFTSAPEILQENIVDNFYASSIIQLSQKEPLFLPDNSKSLRNRVITISSNEKVSKYALKTFTYFSNVFLKCLNLDSFNLKFSSFITYVTSNIKSIFSAFLNRFSNFNFDINKIRLYEMFFFLLDLFLDLFESKWLFEYKIR